MNIFKSKEQPATKSGKIDVTAKQIHEDFNNQVALLLENVTEEEKVKAERCRKLRANNLTSVNDYAECAAAEIKKIGKQNAKYYSEHYANYKYVDETAIELICKKYALLFGAMDRYTGEIPDKNLNDLWTAKVKNEDHFCIHLTENNSTWGNMVSIRDTTSWYGQEVVDNIITSMTKVKVREYLYNGSSYQQKNEVFAQLTPNSARGLMIAAPVEMFKDVRESSRIESGYRIVDKDPIVFYKVIGGYLIITAWGDEANIPEIVNEKMN